MVYRSSDSRLLTALLTTEQAYSKSLVSLLSSSHSSLASFSAYASATSPPASHALLVVAGSLASADDALRRYARAVDAWRQSLDSLKKMEQEVANVVRDREILVTRLLKASKSHKPTRESILFTTASPTNSNSSLPLNGSSSSKLSSAQAQLQACEAHLAALEKSVEERSVIVVRDGLNIRCRAMVECGWTWGEMGKEALRALESMGSDVPQSVPFQPTPPPSVSLSNSHSNYSPSPKSLPLPPIHDHVPITHSSEPFAPPPPNMPIPAAHKIDDIVVPTSSSDHSHTPRHPRHVLSHRISELTEPPSDIEGDRSGGDSSSEELHGELRVVENERFAVNGPKSTIKHRIRPDGHSRRLSVRSTSTQSDILHIPDERTRWRSIPRAGIFGSIRGFFTGKPKEGETASWPENDSDDDVAPRGFASDVYVPSASLKKTRGRKRPYLSEIPAWSEGEGTSRGGPWSTRLRQDATPTRGMARKEREGAESDPSGPSVRARGLVHTRNQSDLVANLSTKGKERLVEEWIGEQSTDFLPSILLAQSTPTPSAMKGTKSNQAQPVKALGDRTKASSISRSGSITSTVSAPAGLSPPSMDKHKRRGSLPRTGNPAGGAGSMNLMSIIEGIGKTVDSTFAESYLPSKYESSFRREPGEVHLTVPKAPSRITRDEIDSLPVLRVNGHEQKATDDISFGSGRTFGSIRDSTSSDGRSQTSPSTSPCVDGAARLNARSGITRPAKSPLRSALRHSRSPSPSPLQHDHDSGKPPAVHVLAAGAGAAGNLELTEPRQIFEHQTDDESECSSSSYLTARGSLDDSDEEDSRKPAHDVPSHNVLDHDRTGGNKTNQHAQLSLIAKDGKDESPRRKVVRVSLKPEFSPPPPSFSPEDEDASMAGASPWNEVRDKTVTNVWDDSSEEDEEYARARRLLGRAANRAKLKASNRRSLS